MNDCANKKQNWDVRETELLLEILKELDIKNCLDGRKVRNNKLFKVAHRRMTAAGYHRTVDQLKFRWKLLKSAYYKRQREPDSPAPSKIQGWWRYEKTMAAIMESRRSLAGDGLARCGRNDDATEESDGDGDGDASVLSWPPPPPPPPRGPPCSHTAAHSLDLIVGVMEMCAVMWVLCCLPSFLSRENMLKRHVSAYWTLKYIQNTCSSLYYSYSNRNR